LGVNVMGAHSVRPSLLALSPSLIAHDCQGPMQSEID
jgi:hypothetical protein